LPEARFMPSLKKTDRTETALITGASTGIGYELARLFARNGYDLILISQNQKRLSQAVAKLLKTYRISIHALTIDLSLSDSPKEIVRQLQRESRSVDILVNNAGYGVYGEFSRTDLEEELRMMQLNMVSLTHLTKLFLGDFLARNRGRILNVASTAGFQPGPYMAVYYASKAYVLSFSEALASELQGSQVSVTTLAPGPTISNFFNRPSMKGSILGKLPIILDAEKVALAGYRGLMKGKPVVIPGLVNKLLTFSIRLSPRSTVTRMVRWLQKGRGH